jgi:hypothetical protein
MKTFITILLAFCASYACGVIVSKGYIKQAGKKQLPDAYKMIEEGQTKLEEGDLVVRLNEDPASRYIKNFNRYDKRYSHAGIVLFENGYPYIFHIVNGEENPGERLRKDSLKQFCSPRFNKAFGIFRYNMKPDEIRRLKDLIHCWYVKGIQFDAAFDLTTDDRMYCSEMVSKALASATNNRILIKATALTTAEAFAFSAYSHMPFLYTSKLKVIAIDDLYRNPFCHLIKNYDYKQ